jgi:hypothetical protein
MVRSHYKVDIICIYFLALDDVKPDVTSNVAVTDDKTQIGFRLPSISDLSEKTKIQ